jgi:cobalt/nickel transport system permease protein
MHIPDGYLGPVTCAFFYIVMVPIWYLAFKKAREKLESRTVPVLAVLSAFSFIFMMFNWPIPDGTTGHGVGGALISALMGPYAATIAVTVALLIQAIFFGDGGITAFGANCFNMAFILPFTSYLIMNLFKKVMKDERKATVIGAAVGGYVGITLAAIFCGLEIGVQPFVEPGYCPYSFWLSVPAMAFAHLTVAGPVEGIVTGLVLEYLYRYSPDYLKLEKIGPKILGV